jgi:altronate dehydratase small subunit
LNVIIVDKKDNVVTALRQLEKGYVVSVDIDCQNHKIVLSQTIPAGHKFALKDIFKRQAIIKYGERIGLASERIGKGQHVHIHNVEGMKGRGDIP